MADLEYSTSLDPAEFVSGLKKIQQENEKTTKAIEKAFTERVGKATKSVVKDFQKAEKEAKELEKALDIATKSGTVGIKKLDDEAIKLEKALKKLRASGKFSVQDLGKGGTKAAAAFGLAAGASTVLIQKVIELGAAAARAFSNIVAGGVAINQKLEDTGKVFSAVFGDPEIGKQVVDFLNDTAEKLNINRDLALEFGRSILPRTDSLETFTELLRLTDIQSDATGKSVGELSFAIREALTGDFVSLRDQFDLSKESVERIKELSKKIGQSQALAQVLGEEFERLGKINVTGTLTTDTKKLQAQFSELQQILGEPSFEAFKELVADIGEVLTEREEEFKQLALSAGELTAAVIDLVGAGLTNFLENVDTVKISEFIDEVKILVENIDNFLRFIGLVADELDIQAGGLERNTTLVQKLGEAVKTLTQGYILIKAAIAGATGGQEAFDQSIIDSIASLKEQNEELSRQTGQSRLGEADDQLSKTNAQKEATEEATEATEESIEATEEAVEAEEKLDTVTKKTAATRKGAASSEGDLTKARKEAAKTKDEIAEAEEDLQADILEAQREAQEKLIQAEIDAAQRREDIARNNAQKLEDIFKKNQQARTDAAIDLTRDEQDIARKNAEALEDLERSQAAKRIDIEKSFRETLEGIQKEFTRSATQAERGRDAIAFLAAVERKDQAISDAEEKRAAGIEELKLDGEARREELERQRQQELEDARIANQRKLEDLQQNLQRELEAQREANARELEEARIAEERKQEAIQASLAAQLEQLRAAHEQRLSELKSQLQAELAAIEQAASKARSAVRSARGGGGGGGQRIAGGGRLRPRRATARDIAKNNFVGRNRFFFQDGGPVRQLSPIIVGEASAEDRERFLAGEEDRTGTRPELFVGDSGRVTPVGLGGPEVFQPQETGRVIPTDQVSGFFQNFFPDAMARNLSSTGNISNVDNSRSITQNVGMLDPKSVTAIAVAVAQRTAREVIQESQ